MEALAWSTRNEWKQIDGVQVFTARDYNAYDIQGNTNALLGWIAALPQEQKVELVYAKLPFNLMNRETQRAFSVAQYDPDFRFILLDKASQTTLHLELQPTITMQRKVPNLPFRPFKSLSTLALSDKTIAPLSDVLTSSLSSKTDNLEKPPAGALDFGNGEILSLKELTERASKAFGSTYTFKKEQSVQKYFISGRFDRRSFDSSLQYILSPPKRPKVTESKPSKSLSDFVARLAQQRSDLQNMQLDMSDLRQSWAAKESAKQGNYLMMQTILNEWAEEYGDSETLPLSDFLQNKEVRIDLLCRTRPGLARELGAAGMTLDDKATLSIFLQLVVEAPGQHESSFLGQLKGGKSVRAVIPNQISLTLSELSY